MLTRTHKALGGENIKHLVGRVWESPLTLVVGVTLTLVLGTFWVRAEAAHRAPHLPGFEWSQHPKTLLIVIPSENCGCGVAPMSVIRTALERDISVVVASTAPNDNTRQLSRMKEGNQSPSMAENVPRDFLMRFAPKDKVGFVCVQNGRILSESQGQSSTLFLDTLKEDT